MYYVSKHIEVSACHRLELPYESKCTNLHGHNWHIIVHCKSETLDENGMVIDYSHIKSIVMGKMDHADLNKSFDFNPTSENIAKWICDNVPFCYKVEVQESNGNVAIYEK